MNAPAHSDLIRLAQDRLRHGNGASVADSVISYMHTSGTAPYRLESYRTNFRNSPEATRRTIELMKSLVWGSVGFPIIHRAAAQVRTAANREGIALSVALHRWVRCNLVYRQDEELVKQGTEGRELLIAPNVLLAMNPAEGDCDDFSMTTAAIAISLGMKVKFIAVATEPMAPWRYSHIYVAVRDWVGDGTQQDWIPLDCSHGQWAGWETNRQYQRYEVPIN